jgi:two-component system, NtrC family, sensor kinase
MSSHDPSPVVVPALTRTPDEQFARTLNGLLEISNLVGSVLELDEILDRIVRLTAGIFDSPVCSVFLFDQERENLVLRASFGLASEVVGSVKYGVGKGLIGLTVQENQMVRVADVTRDPRFTPVPCSNEERCRAFISAPLRIQEDIIGVMSARRHDVHEFLSEECTLFETICKQVAIVIEKGRMYQQKVEADRLAAISISLSEIAHYIKNLLQGMKGGIYFVDMGLKRGDLETARKGWGVLQRGNRKIAALVENMLNYSREIKLKLEKHNINSIIYDILHQIDDSAVDRGVALVPETMRDLPAIDLDYDRIFDALLNLITNAIDAIPSDRDDGLVIVRTRLSDDRRYVEVLVEDNGIGMAPEIQSKIFNLFFTTKGEQGSGIGLAVTRKIVEQLRGEILVSSTDGKGTTFTIRLPVQRPAET